LPALAAGRWPARQRKQRPCGAADLIKKCRQKASKRRESATASRVLLTGRFGILPKKRKKSSLGT
jgi:hypothetical protein